MKKISSIILVLIFCITITGCKNNSENLLNSSDKSSNTDVNIAITDSSNSNISSASHTHKFSPATCPTPKFCPCGDTEGEALGHNYFGTTCTICGAKDPTPPAITFGNVGIIGDSYSTYRGYNPMGINIWYASNGNGKNELENDVNDVAQTWRYSLIKETNSKLVLNESSSGSSIAYRGWGGITSKSTYY